MAIRKTKTGTVMIREDAKERKELDMKFLRVGPMEWSTLPADQHIADFKNRYLGKPCYIIGKGPSLDELRADHFDPTCPVFCVNESFTHIKSLGLPLVHGVQQDRSPGACMLHPTYTSFIGPRAAQFYQQATNTRRYIQEPFGLPAVVITARVAQCLAKYMGCVEYRMYAFDAATTGNLGYAKSLPPQPDWAPTRFLDFVRQLRAHDPEAVRFLEVPRKVVHTQLHHTEHRVDESAELASQDTSAKVEVSETDTHHNEPLQNP